MRMKYRAWLITVFFTLCVLRADARPRVSVLDADGKFIKTAPSIMLGSNRIGVRASSLRALGLSVEYEEKKKKLTIYIHGTDTGIALHSHAKRIYNDKEGGYESEVYPYPLALKRRGHFYVSVREVQRCFPSIFSYRWDQKKHTLLLQPGATKPA